HVVHAPARPFDPTQVVLRGGLELAAQVLLDQAAEPGHRAQRSAQVMGDRVGEPFELLHAALEPPRALLVPGGGTAMLLTSPSRPGAAAGGKCSPTPSGSPR